MLENIIPYPLIKLNFLPQLKSNLWDEALSLCYSLFLPTNWGTLAFLSIDNSCLSQLFHWWLQYTVNSLKINNFNPPGLPQWFRSKESYCNAGNMGLVPGSGKISWRSTWQPTPVFLPGKSRRQRILVAAAHAVAQSRALLSGYSCADFGLNTVWEGTSNGAIPSKCGVYFLLVFFTEKVTCEIKMQTVKKGNTMKVRTPPTVLVGT